MKTTKQMEAEINAIPKEYDDFKELDIRVGDFIFRPGHDYDWLPQMRDGPFGDNDFIMEWAVDIVIETQGSEHWLRMDFGRFRIWIEFCDGKTDAVEIRYDDEFYYIDNIKTSDNFLRDAVKKFIELFDYSIFEGRVKA